MLKSLAVLAGVVAGVASGSSCEAGDPTYVDHFYVADKGRGYVDGETWVVIESADGNGFAVAEAVVYRGRVVDVVLIYSDKEFTAPPTVTIVGAGAGANVYAVLGE